MTIEITSGDIKIEKRKFHYQKYPINRNNAADTAIVIATNMVSFNKKSFKYFIGCKDEEECK